MTLFNKFLMLATMTLTAATSMASDDWRVKADECWNRTVPDYTDARIWEKSDGSLSLQVTKMSFGKQGQAKCHMAITVDVKSENESCDGLNTLGFAIDGRKSFATGKVRSNSTMTLAQVFSHYSGSASGLAVLGGVGSWNVSTKKGVHIEDKIIAIPIPMMGGNLGLGYTSCQVKFDLVPAENEALVEVYSGDLKTKQLLPLEQILDLSF